MPIATFLGVETALRGILAQQQALDTTANNVTNANTPGYTRQIAVLAPTQSYPYPSVDSMAGQGQIGTGVTVSEYQRVRNDFLDVQTRSQMMQSGYYDALNTGLDQVQGTLAEPSDNGVSTLLSNFWGSWQDLGNNPESTPARQSVLENGQALADGLNQLDSQLTTLSSQNDQNVALNVQDLNSTATQIAALNGQIQQAEATGLTPNDLLDQRDNLIDHLSTLANVTVVTPTPDNGERDIWIGSQTTGFQLVSGTTANSVSATTATGLQTALPELTLGTLGGLVALGQQITTRIGDLNTVVGNLITATNTQHEAGVDMSGTAGGVFFNGTNAGTIAVAITDPSKLAASAPGLQPGDGSNATAIADLQSTGTIDSGYQTFVTDVGSDAQQASRSATNADAMLQSLENRRQSVSGVSLDEEMTNLLKYQRGYQASARALTAMDDMLNTLISRTGTVGL